MGANYGILMQEAGQLQRHIEVARLIGSDDVEGWQSLPTQTIRELLLGIASWSQVEGRNKRVLMPKITRERILFSLYTSLSLSETVVWALACVATESERKALAS